ncbi:hypothetical protein EI94DRAFT_1094510 [Lactarius quietus]|nr:hypothetical protein EI94DRAFT_1094510 [Lactarius quietus]
MIPCTILLTPFVAHTSSLFRGFPWPLCACLGLSIFALGLLQTIIVSADPTFSFRTEFFSPRKFSSTFRKRQSPPPNVCPTCSNIQHSHNAALGFARPVPRNLQLADISGCPPNDSVADRRNRTSPFHGCGRIGSVNHMLER